MAAEAVVLLKNENEILPLDENAVKKCSSSRSTLMCGKD